MGETILKMQGIQKYFSGVHALKGVDFELKAGEVHALMGENGAGKSTLMKCLFGVYQKNAGKIFLEGKEVMESKEIAPGTSSVAVKLTGIGKVKYDLYINDEFYNSQEVNFGG